MSKTKKVVKKKKMNICTFVLERPIKKKGKYCGSPCKRGNRCPMHTNSSMHYRQFRCSNMRYKCLIKKSNQVLLNQESILKLLKEKKEMNKRKIDGINMFLGIKTEDIRSDYILYIDNHKYNAMSRKSTLQRRNEGLNNHIKELKEHIRILRKIKKLFSGK